jgi:hypothetical protein
MSLGFTTWQRMRTIVRLEIGTPKLGTMLKDHDVNVILDELKGLRALKLLFCHLITHSVFAKSSPHGLRSLTTERMNFNAADAAKVFRELQGERFVCFSWNFWKFMFVFSLPPNRCCVVCQRRPLWVIQ